MEKTLVLVKPDGVKRGLIGEIISRFEKRGLKILGLKMLHLSQEQANKHYEEHIGKAFFNELANFITSGRLVALVVAGENAVKVVRTMMGTTKPVESMPGTIRGDFGLSISENIVHGSDSVDSAIREVKIYFDDTELFG